MLTVLIVTAVICVLGFCLAFYLGWFNVSPDDTKERARKAKWVDTRKAKAEKAEKARAADRAKRV